MPWIDADALKEKYADKLSVQRVFGYDAGFVAGIRAALEMPTLTQPNEPLTMEELRESPHGKIKNSTLQSICNRANEIASRPPEVSP